MTSQVWSKNKCLTIWRIWFCRAQQPYQMEVSRYNNMDHVWHTSKYHPKLPGRIFKIKSFKVTRSRKGQAEMFMFCARIHVFSSVIRKKSEKDPRTLFERPKLGKIWKSQENGNSEKVRNSVKNGHFRQLKHQNSAILKDIWFKLCTRIHITEFFYTYSGF